LTNATVSGKSAGVSYGGGIFSGGGVTLTNSTVAFNTSVTKGGGIGLFGTNQTHTINNSIIANNVNTVGNASPDIGITVPLSNHAFTVSNSLIFSPIGIAGGGTITGIPTNGVSGNIIGVDPQLLPLGNYGGPTQTHALALTSSALNAGSNALAAGLTTDQRGAPGVRIVDGTVDIGAFEWQGTEIVPIGQQNQTISSFPSTLDVSVKVVEKVFNLAPSVGATVDFSTIGDVTGSFSNGTSIITDASGIALNFFNLTAATGDFQILAGSSGLETLTFKITNNVAAVAATDFSFLSEIEQEFDSLEIREEDILFARGCLSTPEDELTQQDKEEQENKTSEEGEDEEVVAGEENEDSSPGSDRACRPIDSGDSEGGEE
ncbi:choice-of-anchor Q domain-containing protein, partial [Spirulina sp. 06S082]|uniref:choice-of-anchor Q domain-containing protein n=1 Tax=Spirulina sp. 06S082 TaxID=3110248 RepID=UPI002B1F7DDC